MNRVMLNTGKLPAEIMSRIMDRGAVYPNDKYPLSFNTAYKFNRDQSHDGEILILDETFSYRSYPSEWWKTACKPSKNATNE